MAIRLHKPNKQLIAKLLRRYKGKISSAQFAKKLNIGEAALSLQLNAKCAPTFVAIYHLRALGFDLISDYQKELESPKEDKQPPRKAVRYYWESETD